MKNYIYCHQAYNPNKGGVVGYLSCLYDSFNYFNKSRLTDWGIENCFLFPELLPNGKYFPLSKTDSILSNTDSIQNNRLKNNYKKTVLYCESWFNSCLPEEEISKIDLAHFTSIHVHGAYNYIPVFNTLKKLNIEKNILKIFTTHNPFKPEYDDMDFAVRKGIYSNSELEILKHYFKVRDEFAFQSADVLLFPTPESIEGYYETWPKFKEIIKNKPIYYCLTSGNRKPSFHRGWLLRENLNIPKNATVFLYLGRFSNTRGYDVLVKAAREILQYREDIYFLVVGESGAAPLISKNWIQVPFTQHPGDYIEMADACVCPNRGSLFDLSMIEMLSLGTPLICSYVGGYKWLKNKTSGALFIEPESVTSLIEAIQKFVQIEKSIIEVYRKDNIRLYDELLSIKKFEENYCLVLDQIYSENKIASIENAYRKKSSILSDRKYFIEPVFPNNQRSIMLNDEKKSSLIQSEKKRKQGLKINITSNINCSNRISANKRKLRKLIRNPKLYFIDFFKKHFL